MALALGGIGSVLSMTEWQAHIWCAPCELFGFTTSIDVLPLFVSLLVCMLALSRALSLPFLAYSS